MFSFIRSSKMLLARNIVAHHIIHSNKLFPIPIFGTTHCLNTLSDPVNIYGLSPESAKFASTRVKIENRQRPNLVIELLNKYGFNQTQISAVLKRYPGFVSYDSEKILLPKLEFFKSIGMSDIGRVLSSDPNLLAASLENRIIPSYKVLKSVIGSDKKMVAICERSSWLFYSKSIIPNTTLLREFKVPSSSIELLLNHYHLSIIQNHELFRAAVGKVKEMGFNPLKSTFVQAVRVFSGKGNKLIWDRCSEEYKKWGWSEDDVLSAFMRSPNCMIVSAEKIEKTMDYLVNNFGCEPRTVVRFPSIVNFNLEKRIIPRCSVYQVLCAKGLIKNMSLRTIVVPLEKDFLERFVTRYEDQLPQLMTVYQGNANTLAL